MMTMLKRLSPVFFEAKALKAEERENWEIVLSYENEGEGPWLTDLSHKPRWDLQDSQIGDPSISGLTVPSTPGDCLLEKDRLINRMNNTQASIWNMGTEPVQPPDFNGFTDVTDATIFLALFGQQAFSIAEKMTALDFMDPNKTAPFLLQGPCCHVPCQVVTVVKQADMSGGLLLTCSRGYAQSMVHAILDAGAEFGLKPAGETRFSEWLQSRS
jgi:hypothetical protein